MTQTIAILGAGRVGSSLARAAVAAGYTVRVAGSGSVDKIALTAEILMPGAVPMLAADAVEGADMVILAVPLHKYPSVDVAALQGKIVIDTMNHWVPVNGPMEELDSDSRSTSEVIAEHFDGARLVKSLNHVGYHELEQDAVHEPGGERRAMGYATDDADAGEVVAELIDRLGFAPINVGPLANGRLLEPANEAFGVWLTADALQELALSKL
ncbi:cyclohexadienyl dehydrogenase [Corynebacterium faecale]|uniref:NADPH-dependent F420 reductase n=1 Tax=Corynebacterium faecale TaxID=1758466 RepID=UPI0025B5262B|nr:NADPH-dependent F420 reductase [Corynebacterium faecale]WJY93264.1 cyclohexadienyl dehydrogenase [Corynebacterium faecale]